MQAPCASSRRWRGPARHVRVCLGAGLGVAGTARLASASRASQATPAPNKKPQIQRIIESTPITAALLFANVAVFGIDNLITNNSLLAAGMKVNAAIAKGQVYRLLSCTFLHGGLIHLLMNMNALYTARLTESLLGSKCFLGAYVASGLAGSLLSFTLSPNPSVGASGAIMGVFGAFWMTLFDNKSVYGEGSKSVRNSVLSSVGLTLGIGLFVPLVDNWGHLGGLLAGVLFTYLFGPRVQVRQLDNKQRQVLSSPRISFTGPQVLRTV